MRMGKAGVGWGLLLLLLGFPLRTSGAISCQDLNERYRTKYARDFHFDWELRPFACPSAASTIAFAIYELETTRFRGNNPPDFYRFLTSRLQTTSFEKESAPGRKNIAAAQNGHLHFYESWTWSWTAPVMRLTTLTHEARHLYTDDPQHVTCTHGANKGMAGDCDEKFYSGRWEGSGYNYGFIHTWWLRDAAENTSVTREEADAYMRYSLFNFFNEVSPEDVKRFAP